MERILVRGIAHDPHLALVTLEHALKTGAVLPQLVARLSEAGVQVRSFFHGPSVRGTVDLVFVIAAADAGTAQEVLAGSRAALRYTRLTVNRNLGAITLVGPGVGGEMAIVSRMLATLARHRIHIEGLITSETRITGYLERKQLERALRALHATFIGSFHSRKTLKRNQTREVI